MRENIPVTMETQINDPLQVRRCGEAALQLVSNRKIQAYLGEVAGSVLVHRNQNECCNRASHTNFLVSPCIEELGLRYTMVVHTIVYQVCNTVASKKKRTLI